MNDVNDYAIIYNNFNDVVEAALCRTIEQSHIKDHVIAKECPFYMPYFKFLWEAIKIGGFQKLQSRFMNRVRENDRQVNQAYELAIKLGLHAPYDPHARKKYASLYK